MSNRFFAGASRFAHLTGLARGPRADAGDDEDRREDDKDIKKGKGAKGARADESDDQDDRHDDERGSKKGAKGSRADDGGDDDDAPDDKASKKSKRASADDDGGDDQDDRHEDDKGSKKSKRARADDGGDDDEGDEDDDRQEMTGKSAVAAARRRERQRCAAIFGAPQAAANVALAASLAFETSLTRLEAIAVLKNAPTAPRAGRQERRNPDIDVVGGGAEGGGDRKGRASAWEAAHAKAATGRSGRSAWDQAHRGARR